MCWEVAKGDLEVAEEAVEMEALAVAGQEEAGLGEVGAADLAEAGSDNSL